MKKNLLFFIPSIIICVLLFMFRVTQLPAHIGISIAGLAVMLVLTALTKSTWKIPALEIIMRAMYLIALVTGGVLMNASGVAAVAIVHKLCAALFALLLIVVFVHKLICKSEK